MGVQELTYKEEKFLVKGKVILPISSDYVALFRPFYNFFFSFRWCEVFLDGNGGWA